MSDPEVIGSILPRVLADIARRVEARTQPAPGSPRAEMFDFYRRCPTPQPPPDAPGPVAAPTPAGPLFVEEEPF